MIEYRRTVRNRRRLGLLWALILSLSAMLKRHQINMNIHEHHVRGIVPDMSETCLRLVCIQVWDLFRTCMCFIHVSETCMHTSLRHVRDMSETCLSDLYAYMYVVYNAFIHYIHVWIQVWDFCLSETCQRLVRDCLRLVWTNTCVSDKSQTCMESWNVQLSIQVLIHVWDKSVVYSETHTSLRQVWRS